MGLMVHVSPEFAKVVSDGVPLPNPPPELEAADQAVSSARLEMEAAQQRWLAAVKERNSISERYWRSILRKDREF